MMMSRLSAVTGKSGICCQGGQPDHRDACSPTPACLRAAPHPVSIGPVGTSKKWALDGVLLHKSSLPGSYFGLCHISRQTFERLQERTFPHGMRHPDTTGPKSRVFGATKPNREAPIFACVASFRMLFALVFQACGLGLLFSQSESPVCGGSRRGFSIGRTVPPPGRL